MTEIEAERGGKCKMQRKLLLVAALLSWASSSITYASTITAFIDFGPGNINDGGMLGRTVRLCANTVLSWAREANMKLSLPRNSIGSCLLALAAALILPAPAAHATPMTFFANLSGANDRSDLL